MSREVVLREAEANTKSHIRDRLHVLLAKHYQKEILLVPLSGKEWGEDCQYVGFRVRLFIGNKEVDHFDLNEVPEIKQHLRDTGSLEALYQKARLELEQELGITRDQLGIEPVLSRAEETVVKLQEILYRGPREWNSDTLEAIGTLMSNAGLVPPEQL